MANYDVNTFLSVIVEGDNKLKIYDRNMKLRYVVDPNIAFFHKEAHIAVIEVDNANNILLDFSSSSESSLALIKLNDAKQQLRTFANSTLNSITGGIFSMLNLNMTAKTTVNDGDLACDLAILSNPVQLSGVRVFINGLEVNVGGKVYPYDCYFSNDNGLTARQVGDERQFDKLFWNGSVSDYNLTPNDLIDFVYLTLSADISDNQLSKHDGYLGTWNAILNDPTLPLANTVQQGSFYIVTVPGLYNSTYYYIGDWIVSNGTTWTRISTPVKTVFGRIGDVVAQNGDYTANQVGAYTSGQTDTLLLGKVNTGTTINGQTLNNNINITASNLGVYTSGQTDTLITNKLDRNTSITGGTFTKITYDSNGLVTSGQTATTNDINDSLDKRYVTDIEKSGITHSNRNVIDLLSDSGNTLLYNGNKIGLEQIQSDWTQSNSGSTDYIKNKPTINATTLGVYTSGQTDTLLLNKVDSNPNITAGVFTKISFDYKGLVTSGQTATTNDIPDSLDKRYVTEIEKSGITHSNRSLLDLLSNSGSTLFYNGVEVGKAQVQTDWLQTNSGSTDFIKNKPTIPPTNLSIFKSGTNGVTHPQRFKWTADLTVSSVILTTNCSNISVSRDRSGTITTYDKTTLVGVQFYNTDELILNDMTINAGYDNANGIIIFTQN